MPSGDFFFLMLTFVHFSPHVSCQIGGSIFRWWVLRNIFCLSTFVDFVALISGSTILGFFASVLFALFGWVAIFAAGFFFHDCNSVAILLAQAFFRFFFLLRLFEREVTSVPPLPFLTLLIVAFAIVAFFSLPLHFPTGMYFRLGVFRLCFFFPLTSSLPLIIVDFPECYVAGQVSS